MIKVKLRPIFWHGNSQAVVRGWPGVSKRQAGAELFRLQLGSDPIHWRPMKSVGHGVREIKIVEGGQFRVLYLTQRGEDIVVLHAFEKKTQRTAKSDIDLAKQRLRSSK
jgi:phage-related protein